MTEIAIIGDNFMRSASFEEALKNAVGGAAVTRGLDLAWPDEPMVGEGSGPDLEGLKEFLGEPAVIIDHIGKAAGLINHIAPLSRPMLEKLPGLQFIAVTRGGPVNIDMDAVRERGIRVVNTPGRNASAVAEFTLGAILAVTRNITQGHEALRAGEWKGALYRADETGRELSELTVGVMGYGAIGRRVVRLLQAFEARVLVSDPCAGLSAEDAAAGVEMTATEDLLSRADVVTLHARAAPGNTHLIGGGALALMKPGAFLVNTARGSLIDENALCEALESGRIRGAALDTFAREPLPSDSPLLQNPKVTLTPHISGSSTRTVAVAAAQASEEVRRWLAGEPALHPC